MNPTRVSDTIVQEIAIKGPAERIFEALTKILASESSGGGPKDDFKSHIWSLTSTPAANG